MSVCVDVCVCEGIVTMIRRGVGGGGVHCCDCRCFPPLRLVWVLVLEHAICRVCVHCCCAVSHTARVGLDLVSPIHLFTSLSASMRFRFIFIQLFFC